MTTPGDRGWICPRCNVVNAPSVVQCSCSPPVLQPVPYVPVWSPPFPTYPSEPFRWERWEITCGDVPHHGGSASTRTDIKVTR